MNDDLFNWEPYNGRAPSQSHSPTSHAAAEAIEPQLGRLQGIVLSFLKNNRDGATDEELCDALHMGPSTLRPRRRELQLKGLVLDSSRIRPFRSGRLWIWHGYEGPKL